MKKIKKLDYQVVFLTHSKFYSWPKEGGILRHIIRAASIVIRIPLAFQVQFTCVVIFLKICPSTEISKFVNSYLDAQFKAIYRDFYYIKLNTNQRNYTSYIYNTNHILMNVIASNPSFGFSEKIRTFKFGLLEIQNITTFFTSFKNVRTLKVFRFFVSFVDSLKPYYILYQ